jgi:cation transport protein ChaC
VLRLPSEGRAEAIDRLWAREMTAPRVYDLRLVPVQTSRGNRKAYAFTVRREHPDYAGRLPPAETARIIAGAVGRRGACRDYLADTERHLKALGIADGPLTQLTTRVEALAAAAG